MSKLIDFFFTILIKSVASNLLIQLLYKCAYDEKLVSFFFLKITNLLANL